MKSPSFAPNRNRRGKILGATVAGLATAATCGVVTYGNHGDTPAEARLAIAGHRFQDPRIEKVINTDEVFPDSRDPLSRERSVVRLVLSLPPNPTATNAMQQYAQSDAVTWYKPGIASAAIARGTNGEWQAFPESGLGGGTPYEELTVGHDEATATLYPRTNDPIGTEDVIYVTEKADTARDQTVGEQPVGAVKLVSKGGNREWVAVSHPPEFPDIVTTTPFQG